MSRTLIAALLLSMFGASSASAQTFVWPENPKNLQVLPDSVRGARLAAVMLGFTSALGVNCPYCHVELDLPSDEKVNKRKARTMLQMVQAINGMLSQLSALDSAEARIEVTCMTCHRSQARPRMLGDLLVATVDSAGVEAAISQYHDLREEFYGGFAYDFSRGALIGIGERLAARGHVEAALRVLELEIEMSGEGPSVYIAIGSVQANAGRPAEAIANFEKAMTISPESWWPSIQARIDRVPDQ